MLGGLRSQLVALIGCSFSCDLDPDLPHEGLALVSAEGLEGGEVNDTIPKHPHQVHDITDFQAWENGSASLVALCTTSCGTLRPRDHPTLSRPVVMQPGGTADVSGESCSLEQGLFPHLFPFNTGAWDSVISICAYLRFRCSQLFSPFTLCKNLTLA